MQDNAITVRLEIKDWKVRRELEKIVLSLEGFQIQKSFIIPSDILILEIVDNPQKEFQILNDMKTSGMMMEAFLTSPKLEPDLLLQALNFGVKGFFPQPIQRENVEEALLKFREKKRKENINHTWKEKGRILNVIGSKGGIGTTTVAVNLATSLSQSTKRPSVALIDMNLLFGEVPIFLNIDSPFNWGELGRNVSRLDETYLMSILSKHSSNVYVLPSPMAFDSANLTTPEIIEKIFSEMQEVFDFIIVDGGQSIDNIFLKTLEISDKVLLVSILSLPCLTNLKRLLWTFQKLGYPSMENIKIIINRYHKNSEIPLKEAEKSINKEIFWSIPNDYLTTMSAINRGKPLFSVSPNSEVTKSFLQLADRFLGNEAKLTKKGLSIERLFNLRKREGVRNYE